MIQSYVIGDVLSVIGYLQLNLFWQDYNSFASSFIDMRIDLGINIEHLFFFFTLDTRIKCFVLQSVLI